MNILSTANVAGRIGDITGESKVTQVEKLEGSIVFLSYFRCCEYGGWCF